MRLAGGADMSPPPLLLRLLIVAAAGESHVGLVLPFNVNCKPL